MSQFSFISAEEALQKSLGVTDNEFYQNIRHDLLLAIEELLLDCNSNIIKVSSHGGTSCTAIASSWKFRKYGSDIYRKMDDHVLPVAAEIIRRNFPRGYTVTRCSTVLYISWGNRLECDFSHVDRHALTDAVMKGTFQRNLQKRSSNKKRKCEEQPTRRSERLKKLRRR